MNLMKDFFISYNRADQQWAEWIGWKLEEAGYNITLQAWYFRPGGNFILDMQNAAVESKKTIAVLSETYLKSTFTQPEWAAALVKDPKSSDRKLIPVMVKQCMPDGLLRPIIYVNLVGLSELDAEKKLLDSLKDSMKPERCPNFPGVQTNKSLTLDDKEIKSPQSFPSVLNQVQKIREVSYQKQLDALANDYKAVNRQINNVLSVVDRNRLKKQQLEIAEQMEKIAIELDALGA